MSRLSKIKKFRQRDHSAECTLVVLTVIIIFLTVITTYFNHHQISIYQEESR